MDFVLGARGVYIAEAQAAVAETIELQPGYAIAWSGQYVSLQQAKERFMWVIPLTLLLVVVLLYLNFRHGGKVLLVLLCLPFSLAGGFWLVCWLGYYFLGAGAGGVVASGG